MSQESAQWLNTRTLIGNAAQRGNAWHYRAEEQGAESNHYDGSIPVEDVKRRLFNWKAVEGDVSTTLLLPDGVTVIKDSERKTICRPPLAFGPDDQGEILGLFKSGYTIHDYEEWLLNQVATILDDDLCISSAGLLKQGGVAWVEVSVPDTFTTPEGFDFRPNILAATSLDGSLSSTYTNTVTATVCDNTLGAALLEGKDRRLKVKHSRNSGVRIAEAQSALQLVHKIEEGFAAQVAELTATKVSSQEWTKIQDVLVPLPKDEGRAKTIATNKREVLDRLWNHDNRVAPWKNTALGVLQAFNTAAHHEFGGVKGDRAERNQLKAVTGQWEALDLATIKTVQEVCAA